MLMAVDLARLAVPVISLLIGYSLFIDRFLDHVLVDVLL